MPDLNRPIRTGDQVYDVTTGQRHVVAYADHERGVVAPCGWPSGLIDITDVHVVQATDDTASWSLVERIAAMPGSDHRARWCQRLLQERRPDDGDDGAGDGG